MSKLKLKVHTSFIGSTGYNNHAQSFFTKLSEKIPLEIRNYTVGSAWEGMSDEPHNGEPYMTDSLKTLLVEQSLWNSDKSLSDHKVYQAWPNPGQTHVDLVLNETNHYYFYHNYDNYRIAYNVWESTLQPAEFFDKLLEFNEVWVPSKWQRDCTIKQGYPADKIFVIPEGVDTDTFFPENVVHPLTSGDRFTFGLFGRWDYRKSTTEIVREFLAEFSADEPVDLILSADNPWGFGTDGCQTTEERLAKYGFEDDRIKVLHIPPRKEYVDLLKSVNVFVSCARSEGWNLPLIEAMACGTPSIYTECSGQMEFAEGKGIPVKIIGERSATGSGENTPTVTTADIVGNYYEPDFKDLRRAMRDAYTNYKSHKEKALADSKKIHQGFNWDRVAQLATDHINARTNHINEVNREIAKDLTINYHFVNGPHVEITGGAPGEYRVEFINKTTGKVEHKDTINRNMWVKSNKRYYVDWAVKVTHVESGQLVLDESISLKDRRVYISVDSSSLGDSLAWFPAVDEFRKKHGCKVICSTHLNQLFEKQYPDIEFIKPGDVVDNIVAMYNIGWYYDQDHKIDLNRNVREVKDQAMQKCAFDILGLDYKETKPLLAIPKVEKKKQIAIAIHGTCQAKYWNNPEGWQEVVDWCKENGYEVVLVSREEDGFMGNSHPSGVRKLVSGPIENVIRELEQSQVFVGIGSGLSWLAWATTTPLVLISGFSYDYTETVENTHRVCAPAGKCSGCFNTHRLDPADWNWCPVHKGTHRMFECSRTIKTSTVIDKIKTALGLI